MSSSFKEIFDFHRDFAVIKEKRKVPPSRQEIAEKRQEALEGVENAFRNSGAPLPNPVLRNIGRAPTADAVSRSLKAKISPTIVYHAVNGKR